MRGHGQVAAIGLESIGSFGAILTRALIRARERVVEVNRPDRLARRLDGKIDRLDAEQIARAVLGQTSTAHPRAKSGSAEVTAPGPEAGRQSRWEAGNCSRSGRRSGPP
jgi:transposase